ncbi:MAG: helix-turn-helix transcriptional regulator [Methylocella sp.]
MGAVEHLKTLCCLGLKPESAMVAVTPLLHEIIPHGWSRLALLASDATITCAYTENPAMVPLFRERLWQFMDDPVAPVSLWLPAFRAVAIGWSLHRQGRGYLESGYYRNIEAPLDSCWLLSAMVGDADRTIAFVTLSRPRSASPFTVGDVQRFDRLRPWLAHAFRRPPYGDSRQENEAPIRTAGPTVLSGQLIVTADARLVYQTASVEYLRTILVGEPANFTRHVPIRDKLPAPILNLLQRIIGATTGSLGDPPRTQFSTAYGVVTLEAKWLVPAGAIVADVAKDPKSCLVAVTVELREHAIAHAARILRECGATPTQTKVGIHLALGKPKPVIADELGIQLTSVTDLTRKLYQTLDVHNSAELGTKIWLGQNQDDSRQSLRRAE